MSISSLPNEVLRYIMGFLSTEERGRICTVSKVWNQCASSLPFRLAELFPTTSLVFRMDVENANPSIDKQTFLRLRNELKRKAWINLGEGEERQLVTSVENASRVSEARPIAIRNEDLVQVGGPPQNFNIISQGPGRRYGSWAIWVKRG